MLRGLVQSCIARSGFVKLNLDVYSGANRRNANMNQQLIPKPLSINKFYRESEQITIQIVIK